MAQLAEVGVCEVCGNSYDKAFRVITKGTQHVFDCFECAIAALAPTCEHCSCKIIGHGVEQDSRMFCGAHCASVMGVKGIQDRQDHASP